mmetsp:Transcript_52378/g.113499  ORF Transcript_52378/g.113499 Transcript_52378/m.113499 type:complete len:136 (+) Transcript_52378:113-520(+)|eukprot:CAMPEP_0170608918 /NCGR_PEP_ID=MMETSP0224-20130122/21842_1 /TAXON_ID=285029 /ORGANISM="Togula jolla, Strain CCCM 725" /LENGTH=135 /DNA_ID=CAMNT_0010934179 /DNA_START=112 /DNA_END=519 /DNA_ORIENTATION=+
MEAASQDLSTKVHDLQTRVANMMLPPEKKVAKCVLDCYSQHKDYESVHKCAGACQEPLQVAAKKVDAEFKSLEGSIQACQQSIMKRLEPRAMEASSDPAVKKAVEQEYEQGMQRCIKETQPLLPEIEARIAKLLK